MLRDVGVRTKLLAVLAIPTVLLLVVTALLVAGQVSAARRAGQVNALTDVAIQVNRVVHSLQEERSATLGYLQANDPVSKERMVGQRQFTNKQLTTLRTLVADSNVEQMSEAVRTAVARSAAAHEELPSARQSVDAGRFFATEADVFYTKTIRTDLDLPSVVATSGTTELAQRLQAYEALSSAIEYASHERDLVEAALLRGTMTESDYALGAALVTQQRQGLQDFQRDAPTFVFTRLDNALAESQVFEIDQVRRELPDLLKGQDPDIGGSVTWVAAANSRISPMTSAESALVADIATVASDTQNNQEYRALVLVLGALVGLGLALMLAVALARRITRPLRRLTVAAGEIGAELPRMVERMQTPGEGPGVAVEPIPVESTDEIGRLAEAFNTVNDVTVQVAQEQAALRASIAEMFVNVARRNQVLLGRQLSQLDKMEAREEDPDVLDSLFKLDHLATRMRRNAESLLVLAGIDSTRRLRSTLPMSDVIRTAVGEIEAFDRIDLSMSDDPEVSGRHALTVAHLLAELLENATHFSNPDTRVVVSASVTGHGVDVTVTDYGLGMSDDEVADANEKIAHPPVAEIAVSQRLGLFVVGRLAPGSAPPSSCAAAARPAPSSPSPCPSRSSRAWPLPGRLLTRLSRRCSRPRCCRPTATRCRSSKTSRPPRRSRRTTCSSPRWPPSSARTTRTTRCRSRTRGGGLLDAAAAADNLLRTPRPARRSRSSRSRRSSRSMRSFRTRFRSTCRSRSPPSATTPSSSTSRTPRSSSCRPSRPRLSRHRASSPTSRSPPPTGRGTPRSRTPRSRTWLPPRSRPAAGLFRRGRRNAPADEPVSVDVEAVQAVELDEPSTRCSPSWSSPGPTTKLPTPCRSSRSSSPR